MKTYELISGGDPLHINIKDYRRLRALAYQRGIQNSPGIFKYKFEEEAFIKGKEDERVLQVEVLHRAPLE